MFLYLSLSDALWTMKQRASVQGSLRRALSLACAHHSSKAVSAGFVHSLCTVCSTGCVYHISLLQISRALHHVKAQHKGRCCNAKSQSFRSLRTDGLWRRSHQNSPMRCSNAIELYDSKPNVCDSEWISLDLILNHKL